MNNQKGFANIGVTVLIVVLIGVAGYFTFRKWQSPTTPPIETLPVTQTPPQTIPPTTSNPPVSISVVDNNFSTNIDGYFKTCMDTSAMYKRINSSWEKVSTKLPGKGLYYLDNKFVGYGMCDFVVCTELPNPYTIQLVEYRNVGEKAPPSGSGYTANTLPVYQTVSLSGDVKIDIQYFSDENCQNKKTFSTVIKK